MLKKALLIVDRDPAIRSLLRTALGQRFSKLQLNRRVS